MIIDGRWFIFFLGVLVTGLGFLRIPLVLGQEFSNEDENVKNPIDFAVPNATTITWDTYKNDKWRAFRALHAATRQMEFQNVFGFFLYPQSGTGSFLFMFALELILYIVFAVQNTGTWAEGLVVAVFSVFVGIWLVLIELGKTLKKETARLQL